MTIALALLLAQATVTEAVPMPTESAPAKLGYRQRVFATFNDVCLKNRGSWNGMKRAAESSPLGFRVTEGKGHVAIDYMAFPVTITLRQRMPAYLCVVESVVEDPISAQDLSTQLSAEGFSLADVQFKPDRKGVFVGNIPGTDRSTGMGTFSTKVSIRLSKSPIQGTQIVQLALTN